MKEVTVPKLTDSCNRYLKAVQPSVNDLQFQETEKILQNSNDRE